MAEKRKIIVSEKDIIRTYPDRLQKILEQYNTVMSLRKSGKRIGSVTISKKLKIPEARIKNWIYENKKPQSWYTIKFLKSNNLIPLYINENDDKFLFLVRLFSFCFGDGHIERKGEHITKFNLYGEKEGLEEVQKELKKYCNINSKIESNYPIGNQSYRLKPIGKGSAAITRLLVVMGAPIGDKVINPFLLPKWLMKSSNKITSNFLGVIFANELTTPKLRKGGGIGAIPFTMNKHEKYLEDGIEFINQLKQLLHRFVINTSKITVELSKDKVRKDCASYKIGFRILNNSLNVLRLHRNLYFWYAKRKQKQLENLTSVIKTRLKEEFIKIEKYKKARKIRQKTGYGYRKIAKLLNINPYTVRYWIHSDTKPRYHNYEDKIKGSKK